LLFLNQLRIINNGSKKYDVIVIARGGGSQTDFTAFENYYLAQSIAGFVTPILTGIGHERNISIADLMSNKALKTPTKVANFIVDNNYVFEQNINHSYQEIIALAQHLFENEKSNLANAKREIIDNAKKIIEHQLHELEKYKLSIKLLSPQNVLARGFAIISHQNNIIINGNELVNNDKVKIQFLNETIDATINI
jgi:exodeoxyribonuclease VII large subunit